MRTTRKNPDFRNQPYRQPLAAPPTLLIQNAVQAGGNTEVSGVVLSRHGRVNADVPMAEISRSQIYGWTVAGPVAANCAGITDDGDTADGRAFTLLFTGTLQLPKGWRVSIPGDWLPLRTSIGQYPAGIVTNSSQLGLYPKGNLMFGNDSAAVPSPPGMFEVVGISQYAAETLFIEFNTSGSGDVVTNGLWPVSGSSAGAAIDCFTTSANGVLVEFGVALTSGEIITAPAWAAELTSVNGWYPPPLFYRMP